MPYLYPNRLCSWRDFVADREKHPVTDHASKHAPVYAPAHPFVHPLMHPIKPYNQTMPTPATRPTPKKLQAHPITEALLGASFPVPLSPLTVAEQLLAPHTYPEGQHPPPTDTGQDAQPFAQEPWVAAASPVVVAGTTTVAPELTAVLSDVGQEVVSQFRPTRQQPPR